MHTKTFASSSGRYSILRVTRHKRGRCRLMVAAMLVLLCGSVNSSHAATGLPPGFQDVPVVSGLSSPTAMEFSPDGRLFVAQQGGQVRVIKNGVLLSTPFLSLTVNSDGERGLLGIAFDPNFVSNQLVYVYYTATAPAIHNRISRFKANGDVRDASMPEVVLLDFDNLSGATNHNGGAIHFGPDGKLYAAHGENANGANSQTLSNLLGKIIRMNPVPPVPDPAAQIPADNPFLGPSVVGKNRLIWALGLRNPFTFSFQPGTGRAFVSDVGAGMWEEINDASAGRNFGWPTTEGPFPPSSFPAFTNPTYSYQHTVGTPTGCAITGGAFYNPPTPTFPASYLGKYFFADFCSGWIYYINPNSPTTATQFAAAISSPVDLKVGPDGALYYLARGAGSVGKIVMPTAPQITQQPTGRTVPVGGTATFTVGASGTTPLGYQWQKNGVNIPGATSPSYTTPPATMADHSSTYRCRVTNSAGTATSISAMLKITRDFDGDGKTDMAVFRPSNGTWYVRQSSTNFASWTIQPWGLNLDVPVPGDYDGDGKIDMAVYRPSNGTWYLLQSSTNSTTWIVRQWGLDGDVPKPSDYDGDGKTDIAVYRPSSGFWYILPSSTNFSSWLIMQWGLSGDVPMPGDYDGDGKTDPAVYRPSNGSWYLLKSSTNYGSWDIIQWGLDGDVPMPGDYDGDGKTDIAVYRPSNSSWYLLPSSTNFSSWLIYQWGQSAAVSGTQSVPMPADYDGDGKTDIAVYNPYNGEWNVLQSSTNFSTSMVQQWGLTNDVPVVLGP